MRKLKSQATIRPFALSLLLHLALVALFLLAKVQSPQSESGRQKPLVIEIQSLNSPEPKTLSEMALSEKRKNPRALQPLQNQVVDQSDQALNDEVPDKSRFLSAHNQVVKKQTVAKNHGEFLNSSHRAMLAGGGGTTHPPAPPAQIAPQGKNSPDLSNNAVTPEKVDPTESGIRPQVIDIRPHYDPVKSLNAMIEAEHRREQNLLEKMALKDHPGMGLGEGKSDSEQALKGADRDLASQTLDYIKDLEPGLETLLNTKEFKYYTFYNRVRKQINQYWSSKVRERLIHMYRMGRSIASNDDKITKLLVTLDSSGNLLRAQIIGDSGVKDLDEAAVDAFKAASPFPNPPQGMVDPDGKIKLRWDFILEG